MAFTKDNRLPSGQWEGEVVEGGKKFLLSVDPPFPPNDPQLEHALVRVGPEFFHQTFTQQTARERISFWELHSNKRLGCSSALVYPGNNANINTKLVIVRERLILEANLARLHVTNIGDSIYYREMGKFVAFQRFDAIEVVNKNEDMYWLGTARGLLVRLMREVFGQ